jgi:hypothetical protein
MYRIEKENEMQNETQNPWDESAPNDTPKTARASKSKKLADEILDIPAPIPPTAPNASDFDLDGLMTDFPTAKDLERFVYDQTGVVLNLKGRANKLKYQIAMDTLNGVPVDARYTGSDNPYIDKAEMVPEDPIKPAPDRDANLPDHTQIQNTFWSPHIPHPDPDARAQDQKCHVIFRKYNTGQISYEILGPLSKRPHGEKIDKFGRTRPEVIRILDPRTGEQTIMREDGTLTPQGKKLRAMMQTFRVNNSNQWAVWVDREFVTMNSNVANNPWDLK